MQSWAGILGAAFLVAGFADPAVVLADGAEDFVVLGLA